VRHLLSPKAVHLLALVTGLSGLVFSGSGCASIVRGSSEKLIIQSMPSGAQVRLSTGQAGVTPWEVEVKRKDTIFVTVTKDGYKEMSTAVISSMDGTSLGIGTVANFVTLPILNDVIDYKTGANFSHKPNPLIVTLVPSSSAESYPIPAAATAAPVPAATAPASQPPVTPVPVTSKPAA
jgi:hypothetical protein